jgi:hypothetical protein
MGRKWSKTGITWNGSRMVVKVSMRDVQGINGEKERWGETRRGEGGGKGIYKEKREGDRVK